MKIISIDPLKVELTPEEQIVKEWHDYYIALDDSARNATKSILYATPADGRTWKTLESQAFRAYLDLDNSALKAEFAMQEHGDECGVMITVGRHDPVAIDCELKVGHDGKHEGAYPFSETDKVRWVGGGSIQGDPLRHRDLEFVTAEPNESK